MDSVLWRRDSLRLAKRVLLRCVAAKLLYSSEMRFTTFRGDYAFVFLQNAFYYVSWRLSFCILAKRVLLRFVAAKLLYSCEMRFTTFRGG